MIWIKSGVSMDARPSIVETQSRIGDWPVYRQAGWRTLPLIQAILSKFISL